MRLDGKAFHTLTRGCKKPFDEELQSCMAHTALFLCEQIQGSQLAYVQSDEISILLIDYNTLQTDAWFDYNIQKMCSVAAGYASAYFSQEWGKLGVFDCRVFNVPKEEVCNYFVWRQQDWERNSIQMLAQAHFSHKELHKKNAKDLHEMLHEKNINWADLDPKWKNGLSLFKDEVGWMATGKEIFTQNRAFIEDKTTPTILNNEKEN
jgi:tRNA(His) 5'-end guanylyltransferase